MEVYTKMMELLVPENIVLVGDGHHPYTIETTRWKKDLLLLKFEGIEDRTTASELTNALVYIKSEELPPLSDGDFYYHEVIGMQVYQEDGVYLGTLIEILETGANDVYLVRDDADHESLIPAIEEMILEIDSVNEKIIVAKMTWYGEGD